MSFIAETPGLHDASPAESRDQNLVDLRPMVIASVALCAFFIAVRVYEQAFALTAGVDSYDPVFQTYWGKVWLF
jgi:methane/ammonia monooxygenase subunit C